MKSNSPINRIARGDDFLNFHQFFLEIHKKFKKLCRFEILIFENLENFENFWNFRDFKIFDFSFSSKGKSKILKSRNFRKFQNFQNFQNFRKSKFQIDTTFWIFYGFSKNVDQNLSFYPLSNFQETDLRVSCGKVA